MLATLGFFISTSSHALSFLAFLVDMFSLFCRLTANLTAVISHLCSHRQPVSQKPFLLFRFCAQGHCRAGEISQLSSNVLQVSIQVLAQGILNSS